MNHCAVTGCYDPLYQYLPFTSLRGVAIRVPFCKTHYVQEVEAL